MVRIELSMSARAFSDQALLFVLDVGARDLQAAILSLLLIRDHDPLGLLIEVGPAAQLLDGAVKPGLSILELLLGGGFGFLRVREAAGPHKTFVRDSIASSVRCLRRRLRERDEGVVAYQIIPPR